MSAQVVFRTCPICGAGTRQSVDEHISSEHVVRSSRGSFWAFPSSVTRVKGGVAIFVPREAADEVGIRPGARVRVYITRSTSELVVRFYPVSGDDGE